MAILYADPSQHLPVLLSSLESTTTHPLIETLEVGAVVDMPVILLYTTLVNYMIMLQSNEERLIDKGGTVEWWMTSFPRLRYFLGLDKIDILKIDCEGCEIALSRDMLREDPYFLHHVDQISIETHVTKTWITTREHVYYFGLMFLLLEDAGFVMEWSSVFGCSKRHEVAGCIEDISDTAWPCGYKPWPGKPRVVLGRSCQEFTWKRYDSN